MPYFWAVLRDLVGQHPTRPLRKRQVGGEQYRRTFGSVGDDLEQELGTEFGQRYVPDLIDGDNVVTCLATQDAPRFELLFGFDELVDQRGRAGEAHALSPTARRHSACQDRS